MNGDSLPGHMRLEGGHHREVRKILVPVPPTLLLQTVTSQGVAATTTLTRSYEITEMEGQAE
jgi:hypothetical protein